MTAATVAMWTSGFRMGDLSLALARGLFVASVLSSFGAALFLRLFAPLAVPEVETTCRTARMGKPAWRRSGRACLAGDRNAGHCRDGWPCRDGNGVPVVLFGTRFGQILALQGLALAGAAGVIASGVRARAVAAVLGGLATLLEAGHSHAFAMAHGLSALLVSQALHLLAAGAWLGGLLPLFILVQRSPPKLGAVAARRFSALGIAAVSTLVATALFQGWDCRAGLRGLTGTAYGTVLLIKAGLFAVMVVIAARNRFHLTPALATHHGERSKPALARSIAVETVLGLVRGACRRRAGKPRTRHAPRRRAAAPRSRLRVAHFGAPHLRSC